MPRPSGDPAMKTWDSSAPLADRFAGCLLGLAVGDALGAPDEGLTGAAMRVAPVGLVFAGDPDEVWRQAAAAALPTHTHPVGIEGAQVLALAVALLVLSDTFDRRAFYRELLSRAVTEEFRWHLGVAARLRPGDPVSGLGSTLHAHRSVVTAIACFAGAPDDFEAAVGLAIGLGDDTDTVAAMTGALVGAFGGVGAIPPALLGKLEDGPPKGRAHITALATKLLERHAARRGGEGPA